MRAFTRRWFFRSAIFHQLNSQEQAFAAHVTYKIVLCFQALESRKDLSPDFQSVCLQLFAIDHVEHRCALCADDGIAAECVEMYPLGQCGCDLRRRDNRGERGSVANPFGHRYDVRHHVLSFETPVMRAGAPESRLHFIGNTHAAPCADMFVNTLEIVFRKYDSSAHSLNRLSDK